MRLMDAKEKDSEKEELTLRPRDLAEFVGQAELKKNLRIFIVAAKRREETLDHVLLYGPPGLGKTTLAGVIAKEMGGHLKAVSGPAIEKSGDLAAILSTLEAGDVLFIDEIHRLPRVVEEVLYGAMEDYRISVVLPSDGASSSIDLDLPPFTLIGATTRAGDLSSPLRARFGITFKIDYYQVKDIASIVRRTARVLGMAINEEAVQAIAQRSRGTPRIANRLYRRVRDFADYAGKKIIDEKSASAALAALKVDPIGLDEVDVNYLLTLIRRFHGGPVGLETIANAIGEETMNLEDVYEPYLLQIGFIDRTSRGRIVTDRAYAHLEKHHQLKIIS